MFHGQYGFERRCYKIQQSGIRTYSRAIAGALGRTNSKQVILDGEPIMDISMDHVKENLISKTMLNGYTESWKVLLNK